MREVIAYVKNDRLDFTIPYEWEGATHSYLPDYIIRLRLDDGSEVHVILEVKGLQDEQDRARSAAAQRWVDWSRILVAFVAVPSLILLNPLELATALYAGMFGFSSPPPFLLRILSLHHSSWPNLGLSNASYQDDKRRGK